MEQYPVPQFIESESKMAFFLTVRQFVYVVIAGAFIFALYYLLPLPLFLFAALLVGGGTITMGFVKVQGIPITTMLLNSIGFMSKTKSYTWKKKESLYPFKTVQRAPLKRVEEETKLGIAQKSGLKKLRTQVELRVK